MNEIVISVAGEWLQDDRSYTVHETLAICRIDADTFDEYIAQGVIDVDQVETVVISYSQICTVSKAARLQRELELDVHAVALIIQLLETINVQQLELGLLKSIQR